MEIREPALHAPTQEYIGEEHTSGWWKMARMRSPRRTPPASAARAGAGRSVRAPGAKDRPGDGMEVFLVRHADAGESSPLSRTDALRPLSPKGRKDAKRAAGFLKSLGVRPEVIASSPLTRARETAAFLCRAVPDGTAPVVWEELQPGGSAEEASERLATLRGRTSVILVGHEPSLTGLLKEWIGSDEGVGISLGKGGVARVKVTSFTPKVRGKLKWLLSPKLLQRI